MPPRFTYKTPLQKTPKFTCPELYTQYLYVITVAKSLQYKTPLHQICPELHGSKYFPYIPIRYAQYLYVITVAKSLQYKTPLHQICPELLLLR
jgi:hypothetical protein